MSKMYDELVKRLRNRRICIQQSGGLDDFPLLREAADAIEELWRENEKLHADLGKAIRELAKQPRWIPVTERLPVGGDDSGAICENVCLLMDDGTVSCGWMNGITKKVYYLNARDDVVIKAPITRVTHWMPLPPAPKDGE